MRERDALVMTHNAPVTTQSSPVKDKNSTPWFTLAAYVSIKLKRSWFRGLTSLACGDIALTYRINYI